MKSFLLPCLLVLLAATAWGQSEPAEQKELDALWAEVSRSVKAGDFAAYAATCHPEGVLVAGTSKKSLPLAGALAGWKPEFDATQAGTMKASVDFRFSQRIINETTAHETGMFLYASEREGKRTEEPVHFEALVVKKAGKWLVLMEYQKSKGTLAEWKALDPDSAK